MAISKIQLDGTTLIDLTTDTVASSDDIVQGKIGHLNDGSVVTGTASSGGCVTDGVQECFDIGLELFYSVTIDGVEV